MSVTKTIEGKVYLQFRLADGGELLLRTGSKKSGLPAVNSGPIRDASSVSGETHSSELTANEESLFSLIDIYLRDCEIRLTAETHRSYVKSLRNLQDCWGDMPISQIRMDHFSDLKQYLAGHLNPTSTNIRLRSIRAFLNWTVRSGYLDRLPGVITTVRVDDPLPKYFTPDELSRILGAIMVAKMKATINLLAETGLRRSEILNCTLVNGYLQLQHTKSRKDRLVPLASELFADYELVAKAPYKPDSISKAFLAAMRKAGIPQNGRSLHCLRHTFALRMYHRTGDIYRVKQLLGHSTVVVTERYLRYPQEYLREVFEGDPQS